MADESSDISGKEQLSIGVRFLDEENMMDRVFLGFVELRDIDAKSAINNFIEKVGLDPEKCVGQGYDGCSTMAGKDGGVQSILRKTYTYKSNRPFVENAYRIYQCSVKPVGLKNIEVSPHSKKSMRKSVWRLKHYQKEQTATMQREKLLFKCIALLQNLNSTGDIMKKYRGNAVVESKNVIVEAETIAEHMGTDFNMPRRFSEENLPAFSLFTLHPHATLNMTYEDFLKKATRKNVKHAELKEVELATLVKETQLSYPSVKRALLISLALPCTTCIMVQIPFSTLRRVKTWLRSTMMENRLVGHSMMSAHKKRVLEAKNKFEKEILLRFSKKSRRLMLK
ncbi:hypothetical protein J437_LFUL005267 [Ladona fulva]|uniref:DUF4371 domain-containing protein n=1 Tax=Ladona fulva TaxID=123851 RepID=A0A8K0KM50_LADFU|nr:hypothetical protein J437_LFUL005267 [Ladona fulva]